VHIYIGFETLKVKCTQYGICSQAAFKNARAMFFLLSGGAGSYFQAGLKKIQAGAEISREGCPRPNLESLLVRGGVFNVLLCLVPLRVLVYTYLCLSTCCPIGYYVDFFHLFKFVCP
jgi:hypothetical protein